MFWGFDPVGNPLDFFVWDEFIDPGKEYECPNCGRRMDESCVAWCEEEACLVCECPDCGTASTIDESG